MGFKCHRHTHEIKIEVADEKSRENENKKKLVFFTGINEEGRSEFPLAPRRIDGTGSEAILSILENGKWADGTTAGTCSTVVYYIFIIVEHVDSR